MLLDTPGASLSGNILAGKGINRTRKCRGINKAEKGRGINRAGRTYSKRN